MNNEPMKPQCEGAGCGKTANPIPVEFQNQPFFDKDGDPAEAQKAAQDFTDVINARVRTATGVESHEKQILEIARKLKQGKEEHGIKPKERKVTILKHGQVNQIDRFEIMSFVTTTGETVFRCWAEISTQKIHIEGDLDAGAKEFAKYLAAHFQSALQGRDGL